MTVSEAETTLPPLPPFPTRRSSDLTPVALNVDGIERLRKKWGQAGRAYYRVSEWMATMMPSIIVTDANVIRDYYAKKYGTASRSEEHTSEIQSRFDLVCRLLLEIKH